jgi:Putative transposase
VRAERSAEWDPRAATQAVAGQSQLAGTPEPGGEGDPEGNLAASAVSGQTPPAGPQWVSRLAPLEPHALAYDKPLCASLDGFTLHAATRAGAWHPAGREALLRYVLRPPVAQERLELRPDGLVRITLKKAYADGTIAVDMDPLSLLCRLATSVPPPRRHTIRYWGVLAPASPWRSSLVPMALSETPADGQRPRRPEGAPSYRPWAKLLARTFAVDVLACPKCHGRMRLLAMVEDPANVARFLATVGEATEVPPRSPGRGPPYGKSRVLRRQALGEEDDARGRWVQQTASPRGRECGTATGRSLRIEPDRGHPASSREGASEPLQAPPGLVSARNGPPRGCLCC